MPNKSGIKNLDGKNSGDYFYYIGQAKDPSIRQKGSAGGALRALVIDLLEKNEIDGALVTSLDGLNPVQKIATTKDEILNSAKSVYQKFNFSAAIEILKNTTLKKIAIVGLPCQIAVYKKIPQIDSRVKIYLGLYCGMNLKFEATEVLLNKLGIKKEEVESISYRAGGGYGGFEAILKNGKKYFVAKDACNYLNVTYMDEGCLNCNDFFAKEADLSFGDCWFKKNYSSILVRGTNNRDLLLAAGSLILEEVLERKFFDQHRHVYNVKKKKIDLRNYRIIFNFLPFWLLALLAKIGKFYKRHF